MKIGIIIHSQSGNTAALARAIADCLKEKAIDYDVELLRTVGDTKPFARHVNFRRLPEVEEYDILLLGSPVIMLSASPAIICFIDTLETLRGKQVLPFVTYSLPAKFLGADQALARMTRKLDILGAEVLHGESLFCFWGVNQQKSEDLAKAIISQIL